MAHMPPELLTQQEVADLLRVTVSTVSRWSLDGTLRPVRIASTVRYRRDDIDAILFGDEAS